MTTHIKVKLTKGSKGEPNEPSKLNVNRNLVSSIVAPRVAQGSRMGTRSWTPERESSRCPPFLVFRALGVDWPAHMQKSMADKVPATLGRSALCQSFAGSEQTK